MRLVPNLTPNPKPSPLNPKPQTLNLTLGGGGRVAHAERAEGRIGRVRALHRSNNLVRPLLEPKGRGEGRAGRAGRLTGSTDAERRRRAPCAETCWNSAAGSRLPAIARRCRSCLAARASVDSSSGAGSQSGTLMMRTDDACRPRREHFDTREHSSPPPSPVTLSTIQHDPPTTRRGRVV